MLRRQNLKGFFISFILNSYFSPHFDRLLFFLQAHVKRAIFIEYPPHMVFTYPLPSISPPNTEGRRVVSVSCRTCCSVNLQLCARWPESNRHTSSAESCCSDHVESCTVLPVLGRIAKRAARAIAPDAGELMPNAEKAPSKQAILRKWFCRRASKQASGPLLRAGAVDEIRCASHTRAGCYFDRRCSVSANKLFFFFEGRPVDASTVPSGQGHEVKGSP